MTTPDIDALVDRLTGDPLLAIADQAAMSLDYRPIQELGRDAADALEALTAENAELREAVRLQALAMCRLTGEPEAEWRKFCYSGEVSADDTEPLNYSRLVTFLTTEGDGEVTP